MKILIKLILLPFILFFALAKGFILGLLGVRHLALLPKYIVELSKNEHTNGTKIKKLKFIAVRAYAEENGEIIKSSDNYIEFYTKINDSTFFVQVEKSFDDDQCAVFCSVEKIESEKVARHQIRKKLDRLQEKLDPQAKYLTKLNELNYAYDEHEKTCKW